jgi:membrane-bound lytic murein transglycosylase D
MLMLEPLASGKTDTPVRTESPKVDLNEPVLDDREIVVAPRSQQAADLTDPPGPKLSDPLKDFLLSETEYGPPPFSPKDPSPSDSTQFSSLSPTEDKASWEEYEEASKSVEPADSESQVPAAFPGKEESDLWDRIRRGFALPERRNAQVVAEVKWFSRNQAYLDRVADRAQPYLHYIVSQVEKRGIPTEIVLLPVVESAFQPLAYSSGRAAGIWQFIPGTGRRFGLKLNWWYDGRRDIVASTRAALDYLEYLNKFFDGDWLLALAAYNSGEGTVLKAMRANRRRGRSTKFWSLQLPRETKQYVPRLLAIRDIVATPEKLGITLKSIADEPYLTSVDINSQLALADAAKLAGMDLEELLQLNPGFNRGTTAPDGPHELLIPLDKADRFATQVAQLPSEERIQWVRHRIRRGDTLGGVALRYGTTIRVLRQFNKLRGNLIRAGHYLVIPIPARTKSHRQNALRDVAARSKTTIHTVTNGDNLWTLSRRFGTTVRHLCNWNGISDRALLQPGQKITVFRDPSSSVIPASLNTPTVPGAIAKPRKITYRVRRGDSLARIAQRYRVTIKQLKRWNNIKSKRYLQPGQKLTLYIALTADSERS